MSARAGFTRGARAAGLIAMLLGATPHATVNGAVPQAAAAPQTTLDAPPVPAAPADAAPIPTAPGGALEPSDDIRDIRGPKFVAPAWLWPAVLAGAALLALSGYGAWRWQRWRRRPRALLPFEAALQQLDNIRTLMQPPSGREFSIAVSDIVRRYIEHRFHVTATHRTTEEFLRDLLASSNPSLARHRGLLSEFLHQCDLAKFAGMTLSTPSMESLHQSARAFVVETAKPDEVTTAEPRDGNNGQAGRSDNGPSGQSDNGRARQSDDSSAGRSDNSSSGQSDNSSAGRSDNGHARQSDDSSAGRSDYGRATRNDGDSSGVAHIRSGGA
jgi:hypothetical protein